MYVQLNQRILGCKHKLWSSSYLALIFIKKTQIKLWNKTLFISDIVT